MKHDYWEAYDTSIDHAELYGLASKNPLFIKSLLYDDEIILLRTIISIEKYAKENQYDLIFGHINDCKIDNEILKVWFNKYNYEITKYNDFFKYIDP
jgi:hypothetical protein